MQKAFSLDAYYSCLRTIHLGRPCILLDCVESTIDIVNTKEPGTVVIAKRQSKGRGQRNNVWQSPDGCAMASIRFVCGKFTLLASKLCFLQHILALSAAKTLEEIDKERLGCNRIRLKWPNDIVYIAKADQPLKKIGGILVQTFERGEEYDIVLSFGLNVFNSEPTTCIADILGDSTNIGIDSIVAQTINHLEDYTNHLNESSFQEMKSNYMERCVQINKMINDEKHGRVKVKEVGDDGYLIGERCDDAKLCTITRII